MNVTTLDRYLTSRRTEIRLPHDLLANIAAPEPERSPSPRLFALRTGRAPRQLADILAEVDVLVALDPNNALDFDLYDHFLLPRRASLAVA